MTAQELYELVKGHPEVWRGVLEYDGHDQQWSERSDLFSPRLAEAALIGLFAVATQRGVMPDGLPHLGLGFMAFEYGEDGIGYNGRTPLEALVRAREAGKERGE